MTTHEVDNMLTAIYNGITEQENKTSMLISLHKMIDTAEDVASLCGDVEIAAEIGKETRRLGEKLLGVIQERVRNKVDAVK